MVLVAKLAAVLNARSGADAGEALRVERQHVLQPLQAVDRQHAEQVEEQHADGVGLPVHLLVRVDAGEPVDQPLDRAEQAVEPNERLALVHPGHVSARAA